MIAREPFDNNKVQLGDLVEDRVTGFKGIAVAVTLWITGCTRWAVQPQGVKDGKAPDNNVIDEGMLVIVKKQIVIGENSPLPLKPLPPEPVKRIPGGPRPKIETNNYRSALKR